MILRTACVFFAIVFGAETLPFSNMNVRPARTIYGDQNFHRLYNVLYPLSRHPERKPLGMFSGRHLVSSSYPPAPQFSDLYNRVKEISADLRPSRFMTPTRFSLNNCFDNVHQRTAEKLNRFGQRVTDAMQQRENHHHQSMQHVKEMLHQRFGPESTMERLKQIFREKQALMNKLNENKWHDKFVAVPFYTMNDDHKIVKKPGVDTGSLFNLKPNNEIPNSLHVPAIESIGTQHPVIPEVTTSSFLLQESEAPATIAAHMVPITLTTHIPEVTDTIWVTKSIVGNELTTPKPPSDTSSKTDTTASIDSTTEVAFLETKVTEISNTGAVETSSITDSAFTSATIAPESTTESVSTFPYEISTYTTASGSGYASILGSTDTQEMNSESYSLLLHSMIPNPKNITSEEISTTAVSTKATETPEVMTDPVELTVPVADDYVTNPVDEAESTTTSSSIQIEDTAMITEGIGIGDPAETDSLIDTENVVEIISTSPSTIATSSPITWTETTTIEPEISTRSNAAMYVEKTTENHATSFPTIFVEPTATADSSFDTTTKVTPTFPPTVLIEESEIPAMTTLVDELSIFVDDDYFTSLTDGMESTSETDSKYSSTVPTEATSQITGGLQTVELEFDETTFEVDDTKIIDPRSSPDRTTASLVETYTTGSIFDDSTIDREITMESISTRPTDTTTTSFEELSTTARTSSIDSFPNYNQYKEEEEYSSPNDEIMTTRVTSMLVYTVPTETTEDPEKITFLEESSEVVDVDIISSTTDSNSITTDTVTMIPEKSTSVVPAFTYADTDIGASTEIMSTISTETPTSLEQMVTTRSPFDSSLIDEEPTTDILWRLFSTNPIETTTMLPERLTTITTVDEHSTTETDAVSVPLDRESTTTSWLYDESGKDTTEEVDSLVFSTLLPQATENPEITSISYKTTDYPWIEIFTDSTLTSDIPTEGTETPETIERHSISMIGSHPEFSSASPTEAATIVGEGSTADDQVFTDSTIQPEAGFISSSTSSNEITDSEVENSATDSTFNISTIDKEPIQESVSTFSPEILTETTTMGSDGSTQFDLILDELVIDKEENTAYVHPTVSANVTTTTDSSFDSTMMRTDDLTLASEISTETTTFLNEVTKYTEIDSIGSVDEAKSTTEGYLTFSSTNTPESITIVAEGSPTVDQASTDSTIDTEELHSTILTETTTSSISTVLPQNNSTNYDEAVNDETVSTFSFTNPTESTTIVPETFTSIESFLRDSTIDESTTMKFGGSTFSSPMSTESTTSVEEIPTAANIPFEIASATEKETIEEVHSILYSSVMTETTDTPEISTVWDVLGGSTTERMSEDDSITATATELPLAISTETTANFEEISASTELTLDSSVIEGDSTMTLASTIRTETFTNSDEISTVSTTSNSSTVADDETTTEIASTLPTTILAETTDSPGDNYGLKANENYTNPDVELDPVYNRTGRVLRDTSHDLPPWFSRTVQSVTNKKASLNSIPLTMEDLRAKRSLSHVFGDTLPVMVERSRIKQWEPMNQKFETFFDGAYRRLTIDDQRKNQG